MLLGVIVSAYTTESLGIHALFGAFLFGAIMPKDSSFVEEILGKLQDLVVVFLLPFFFAVTGLRTSIGLVHGAEMWLDAAAIVAVAVAGKWGGSTLAARLTGLGWREAGAVGVLMNTRGLMGWSSSRSALRSASSHLRSVTSDDPIEVVVSEARRNYDLVVLGVSESFGLEPSPFGARHERIARECPASLLVVRRYERRAAAGARGLRPFRPVQRRTGALLRWRPDNDDVALGVAGLALRTWCEHRSPLGRRMQPRR